MDFPMEKRIFFKKIQKKIHLSLYFQGLQENLFSCGIANLLALFFERITSFCSFVF